MNKLIYIKVYKGYLEARTVGENNEKQYFSNTLNHPRTLAWNFLETETLFKEVIAAQPKVLFGFIKPKVLVHLVPAMEGGYTDLELRFFREVAYCGGLSKIYLADDKYGPQQDHELADISKWL